jgi:hypothetical protein
MVKVIEIRKAIQSYLKSKHPRVYFQDAPKNAVYPYLVYDLSNSVDDGSMENFTLDVDGWDTPDAGDTTVLETLMSDVDGDGHKQNPSGLHRKTIMILDKMSATFYRENRLPLPDDDKRIHRRKYIYQIRTHM